MSTETLRFDVPVLITERLRMRAPSVEDLEAETAFFATERSEFVGGPLIRGQVWRMLATLVGHWLARGYGFWGVEDRESGEYYGHVGLWFPEGWPEPEIGWTVMDNAEGKGIAFEAATAARRHAYDSLGWTTAISLINTANIRSQALAKRMGAFKDAPFIHDVYGKMDIWRHPSPSELTAPTGEPS